MYQFKYTYSNGVDTFSRIFTLEEIEQGCQFDEISDSPLLKDYKIMGRQLVITRKAKNGVNIFDSECWDMSNAIGYIKVLR